MTYKAPSYITDTNYGYRVKSLLILLAKTIAELNTAPSKISDLRSIIYHLEKTKENIFDVQNEESEKLAESISHHLDANIRSAEAKIKEIDIAYEQTRKEKEFILFQLNEHGVPWHDRSVLVGNFGKSSPFLDSHSQIENSKVATAVYHELCAHIPPEIFKIKLLEGKTNFNQDAEPAFSAVITFSSAYGDKIKGAIKSIAKGKLEELSRGFGISDAKDLEELESAFLYDFYAPSPSGHLKPLFTELVQSSDPDRYLAGISFHHELVFLNLEEYYSSSDLLSEYVSMISKNNQIVDPLLSQKAESNCMEAYYEHHKGEVNIGRLMQALEREMEASQSLQQISQ